MSTSVEKKRKPESDDTGGLALKHPRGKKNSEIKKEMSKFTVNDLLVEMKDGSPITLKTTDSIYDALTILLENKISSAPIMDNRQPKICVGFVDMMDICTAIVDILESSPMVERLHNYAAKKKDSKTKQNTEEEEAEDSMFEYLEQSIVQGISAKALSDFSKLNVFGTISLEAPLIDAIKELSKPHHLRLCVIDPNTNEFMGVITQSGVMEFALEEFVDHATKKNRKISDLKLSSSLQTIGIDKTAFEAFEKMKDKKVSALGICNRQGTLLDVISASDFTPWTEWLANGQVFRFSDFSKLKFLVGDYLSSSRAQRELGKRRPVMCKYTSLLQDVAGDMLYNHVHQVFVVDENDRPEGVVTYTDLVSELLHL